MVLYQRPGCYLCEQAADMLAALGLCWREVNVDGDAELRCAYGDRVPVLEINGVVVGEFWISAAAIQQFLDRH